MHTLHEQIELTEKEVRDFLKCPVYYEGIHKYKLVAFETISMQTLLNKIAKLFYANLMNGEVLSPSKLKNQWDKICKKYSDYLTPQRTLKGIDLIMKLYNHAKKTGLIIANMSVPYRLFVHGDKIDVGYSGEIETLAAQKNGKLEILITDFNDRLPDQYLLDLKIKHTLDMLGYMINHNDSVGVHIYHVNSDKDFFTYRGHDDFKRTESALENIAYSIKHNLFYPRENIFCSTCGTRYFCQGWRKEHNNGFRN